MILAHCSPCQVYAIAFNNPYGDKVVTGSFDKTCKLWDAYTGQLYYTLKGKQGAAREGGRSTWWRRRRHNIALALWTQTAFA